MSQPSTPTFNDPAEAVRFAQYREAQIEEYGTYIAAGEIKVGNTPAFGVGHPVPKSTAEAMGWHLNGIVIPAGSPLPVSGVDRAAQLRARQAEIERERHAIAVELAAAEGKTTPDYAALTVVQLRDELATRGLATSGLKDELVARLVQADSEQE